MAEYVVKLADERGRIQEQVQIAGSAEELRTRFTTAGYYVYSVRPRGMRGVGGSRKKANLEAFIIFNQQFLTLVRAGLPILHSLDMLVKGQKNPTFRAQLEATYRGRALGTHLRSVPIFSTLSEDFVDLLRDRVELVRFAPGQVICEEGAPADARGRATCIRGLAGFHGQTGKARRRRWQAEMTPRASFP